SSTLTCLNEIPPATLPNHASMVTGLSVQEHGVILDFELSGQIGAPTMFDMATKTGRRVAFFVGKKKLAYLCRRESAAVYVIETNLDNLTDQIITHLATAP